VAAAAGRLARRRITARRFCFLTRGAYIAFHACVALKTAAAHHLLIAAFRNRCRCRGGIAFPSASFFSALLSAAWLPMLRIAARFGVSRRASRNMQPQLRRRQRGVFAIVFAGDAATSRRPRREGGISMKRFAGDLLKDVRSASEVRGFGTYRCRLFSPGLSLCWRSGAGGGVALWRRGEGWATPSQQQARRANGNSARSGARTGDARLGGAARVAAPAACSYCLAGSTCRRSSAPPALRKRNGGWALFRQRSLAKTQLPYHYLRKSIIGNSCCDRAD